MALAIIKEARSTAINGRLFPGLNSVKVGQQVIRYRDRLPVSDWAAHDLRRSVCTHLAKMGVPTLHIGAVGEPPSGHEGWRHAHPLCPTRLRPREARSPRALGQSPSSHRGRWKREGSQHARWGVSACFTGLHNVPAQTR